MMIIQVKYILNIFVYHIQSLLFSFPSNLQNAPGFDSKRSNAEYVKIPLNTYSVENVVHIPGKTGHYLKTWAL